MRRSLLLALALAVLGLLAAPAEAHRLRVFATVEGGVVAGYAFFVGGGRPEGARVIFRRGDAVLHETITGAEGAFRWRPPTPGPITVVVDPGDGHVAETTLDAERFGVPRPPTRVDVHLTRASPPMLDPAVEAAIEAAVARQLRPLLEAAAAAESRIRLTDVMGGLGMIAGLVGVALWARSRQG